MNLNSAEQQLRHLSSEVLALYVQAVQMIAGAGDRLSYAELELFCSMARLRGIPDESVKEWTQNVWNENEAFNLLSELQPELTEKTRRLLILDAVRIAKADGVYSHEEEDAVRKVAEGFGVDEKEVVELEILASLEKNVRDLKNLLFDG